MNRLAIAVSLALALSTAAFAQDNSQNTNDPSNSSQSMNADSQSTSNQSADAQDSNTRQPTRHHRMRHNPPTTPHDPAYMALTGNEPKDVAYQYSNQFKQYPAVDHGHVPGDPPVINHSDDQASVSHPTQTTITIPPGQQ